MSKGDEIRRGRRSAAAQRRVESEVGKAELDAIINKAHMERPGQVEKKVQEFFDKRVGDTKKKSWETEGEGLGPQGELLTLEDLIFLKPFSMEDLNSTVAFRANEKMFRAFQRLKESSGGAYDIMSDLYRDAAAIGLLVLSERHKSILGLEVVISRAENHQRLKEEAVETALRLKEALKPLTEEMRRVYFHSFMEAMEERPRWIQETYMEEIRADKMLNTLLEGISEPD